MIAAICLLAYAAALAWLAPPLLSRVTCGGRSPKLAVTVWLTAIAVAVSAWIAGTIGILRELVGSHSVDPMRYCTEAILALHDLGWGGDIALGAAGFAAVAASLVTVKRIAATLQRFWRRSQSHAHEARLIGAPTGRPGVILVHTDHAAAYCVAGKPDAIVVTSSAVQRLTEPELAAVLAHEQAHLNGRHPQLMMLLRALATSLPRLPLFASAVTEVGRLVEMNADDVSARRHGRDALLTGLVTLAGPLPDGGTALAAAGTAVLARAERLAAPAMRRALLGERLVLMTAHATLVAAPLLIAFVCHH
ncbi:M56 family metallopeptidase [Mycolicibacterium iranicum]|uniref:M56 family metallopeptidase n=1 Tax=Mycolicibacterium iranicum TaxID=912594 RepID=A0A1X1WM82_MYCIR|nr:M56 family metallopeptidase [Mycolicibacterium iranicum]MCZ0728518.1 M56 family metallopeptidase [Mycolicibacterium iranicum]ORV87670.1 hypothetical protein AWC12_14925 [Mycolicibacterium iranicum]